MHIIIAGASMGIGFEVVKTLVSNGNHKILILSRTVEKLESLQTECLRLNPKSHVISLGFDLENDDFTRVLTPFVQTHLGSVDILLYNAGLLINKSFSKLCSSDFDRMFQVNVKGAFSMTQALLPLFSRQSHIVTISSMGGVQGSAKFPGLSLYSASKGALAVMTECLAEEFRDQEIKCFTVQAASEIFTVYKNHSPSRI